MHCPRCGSGAAVNQTFCRACGFHLEKVADLLGESQPPALSSDVARLQERQQKFERWAGIAGVATGALLLLLLSFVVFYQMILKGGAIALAGLLIIVFALGAGIMGGFQTYSKHLKEKLAQRPSLPSSEPPPLDTARTLDADRVPVTSITDRTTELLTPTESPQSFSPHQLPPSRHEL